MTEVQKLANRLYGPGGLGVTNFGFTRGSNLNTPPEQLAAEINKALTQLEVGDFELANIEDD